MFLLARKIKAMGVKMVMSGEGADEALGGYLYFHKAPNGTELHEECVRKINDLYMYDCLRANKATMAHGLEARVPFLDFDVLDEVMFLDPDFKMIRKGEKTQFVEKWLMRAAWRRTTLLPEVLWRQKSSSLRRRLLVDRRPQGPRREGHRHRHGDRGVALPVPRHHQGGCYYRTIFHCTSTTTMATASSAPCWAVHCVLDRKGHRVG